MSAPNSAIILPDPPEELKQLSYALRHQMQRESERDGFLPFSRYMEMALYEPGLGYYSAGLNKLGAGGDFVTAPELGSLFACCIARQVEQVATVLGSYDILELGAGTGRLALDLLRQLPDSRQPKRYMILERSADLRMVQQQLMAEWLPGWQDRVKWLSALPGDDWDGILLANEVVDALAVERFRLGVDGVEQLGVAHSSAGFDWSFRPAPASLERAVIALGIAADGPYTSELNLHLEHWLRAVTSQLRKGLALFIDYGYPRSEYYRPDRSEGTMMCHYRHRAHSDAFFWPGLQDITAFVDFTAMAEAADACALEVAGFTSQCMFLLGCGLDRILPRQMTNNAAANLRLNAEARQLTLPGNMGERFQVMALTRDLDPGGLDIPLRGFALRDLRHRL
jgi:SAM-dependent MidA family methyltransferase